MLEGFIGNGKTAWFQQLSGLQNRAVNAQSQRKMKISRGALMLEYIKPCDVFGHYLGKG